MAAATGSVILLARLALLAMGTTTPPTPPNTESTLTLRLHGGGGVRGEVVRSWRGGEELCSFACPRACVSEIRRHKRHALPSQTTISPLAHERWLLQ